MSVESQCGVKQRLARAYSVYRVTVSKSWPTVGEGSKRIVERSIKRLSAVLDSGLAYTHTLIVFFGLLFKTSWWTDCGFSCCNANMYVGLGISLAIYRVIGISV